MNLGELQWLPWQSKHTSAPLGEQRLQQETWAFVFLLTPLFTTSNLCCFPPVPSSSARFYGILRAATLDGIVVTEASSSSGLRRSSNGVRLQPGAVSQTSHAHSQPALISLWLLWLPYIIITAPKTLFPHCFVACLFLPAVCLCIHFKQRECSHCAEGPD